MEESHVSQVQHATLIVERILWKKRACGSGQKISDGGDMGTHP